MPAAVPDRYRLEMRIGRDADIEEWLATDVSLDRPVLIRSLGPDSTAERRRDFVATVSAIAAVSHQHLAKVYAVSEVTGGAYGVFEWTGGSTAEDSLRAAQPIDLQDFLPNAAGLAGALATVHAAGVAHGSIDLSAISYSGAHPAKLCAFGRVRRVGEEGDVRALATALETALTGSPPGGPPPSERIDGVPKVIDRILRSAQSGQLSAEELEKALLAAPTLRTPSPEPRAMSRRLLVAALILVVLAIGLVALGLVFSGGPTEPVLPTRPDPTTTSSSLATTTTTPPGDVRILEVAATDPFGGAGENDDDAPATIDGDAATAWRTETYADPLPLIKPGVGLVLTTRGTPGAIQLSGISPGTEMEIYWSTTAFTDPAEWERVAAARASTGTALIDLPGRTDGYWLLWLVDLPQQDDGTYWSIVSEVRFLP